MLLACNLLIHAEEAFTLGRLVAADLFTAEPISKNMADGVRRRRSNKPC